MQLDAPLPHMIPRYSSHLKCRDPLIMHVGCQPCGKILKKPLLLVHHKRSWIPHLDVHPWFPVCPTWLTMAQQRSIG